jgi:hypothetical protein
MSFVGAINAHMRAVLSQTAERWRGLPLYVACSGNFTVERILAHAGIGAIHSNDVSIYSCALGWALAGHKAEYRVVNPDLAWLGDSLGSPWDIVATLLLCGEWFKAWGDNPYSRRMAEAYRRRWPALHAATVERVKKATDGLSLATFFAGDCREFLTHADREAVCVSFPPTYRGGYERLYRRLEKTFDWPKPAYAMFGPDDFEVFGQTVRSFRHWMISSDVEQPALQGQHLATVQATLRAKPVFMYASGGPLRLSTPHQNLGAVPWPPRTDAVVEPIQVVPIDCRMMNTLRSEYLATAISTSDAPKNYAVLSGGRLVGAFSLALPSSIGIKCDLYLLSDFAVRPTPHRRLSKLILACAVSREVRDDLEQWRCGRVETIATTAFTDKPVSMKYRGLFDVHSRAEGRVNYLGPAGRWSLREGYLWWQKNHSHK